jgi:hypothetical protein
MRHLHYYPSTASMVPHIVLHLCDTHSSDGLAQAA